MIWTVQLSFQLEIDEMPKHASPNAGGPYPELKARKLDTYVGVNQSWNVRNLTTTEFPLLTAICPEYLLWEAPDAMLINQL